MKSRKLIAIFVALCLLSVFNPVPVVASLPSTSPIDLDPLAENARGWDGWDNAWTETIFGNGTPPFKTIVYSSPQVTWNGTQWVKYEIKPVNETAVILRTPTCSYLVEELTVSLLDPNGTLHVGRMRWNVEQYSGTLNKWVPKIVETASVGYNSTYVWQKWIFPDGSEGALYISKSNKQTVTVTSKTSAAYRVAWQFADINATRIIHSNGMEVKLDKGSEISLTDFNFSQLTLYDKNKFSLLIDYTDIEPSYFREFISGCSETGLVYVNLIYGNWTINSNESITVDPETETFPSEAALDGTLYEWGTTYPPTDIDMTSLYLYIGQYPYGVFVVFRGYVSFNTSSIRDYAIITNATLKLKTYGDWSATDFTMRIMGGSYDSSLETDDWNCGGDNEVATWPSSQYPGDDIYVNITIPTDQINKTGRTQFELKSDREGTQPSCEEYIMFYSGEHTGSEPQLEITWLPHTNYIDGQWWYYWNSTTNEKAAIVLFGGGGVGTYVLVRSLYKQDPSPYYKEKFVQDLHSNGFDVLSPKNDSTLRDPPWEETSYYDGTQDWVKNASMWLVERGYQSIFLFGFSAGGVVAAYEIQKDYAIIFSAAVVADAPVDYDPYGAIFNSADTASQVKVPTSFIVGNPDMQLGNITDQMKHYYDNTNIHKEWHLWDNEDEINDPNRHDPFPDNCLTHPDPPETVFDVAYNWYQQHPGPSLVIILNTLGFTNIEASAVETFIPGTYRITLYAEFANYHASNELSWYPVETTQYNLIFSGPEGNYGYVDPPIVKTFTTNSQFGLSFLSPEARYFTETSRNPDGIKHAMIYRNLDEPYTYLIGFENTLGGGDRDYNDMVISLERAPETLRPNAAGDLTQWYYQYPASGEHWDKVDEETSDGDATYIQTGFTVETCMGTDLYNIPDTAIPPGSTINKVTVYVVARSWELIYRGYIQPALKTYGTVYLGASARPPTAYTLYSYALTTNPYTGQPWTIDEINALQIGIYGASGYNPIVKIFTPVRCTQVYVMIDFTIP